jgi:hypothetical protein
MAEATQKCVCCGMELGLRQIYRHLAQLQCNLEHQLNGIVVDSSDDGSDGSGGGGNANVLDAGVINGIGVGVGEGGNGGDRGNAREGK